MRRKKNTGRKIIAFVIGGTGAKQDVCLLCTIGLLDGDFPWVIISSNEGCTEEVSEQKKPEGSEIGGSTPPKMKEWEHRRLGLDDLFLLGTDAEETLGSAGRKDPRCRGSPIDQIGTLLKNHSNIGGRIFGYDGGELLGGCLFASYYSEGYEALGCPKIIFPIITTRTIRPI